MSSGSELARKRTVNPSPFCGWEFESLPLDHLTRRSFKG